MLKLGVVMDAFDKINCAKDSTIAILQEAAKRQYQIFYMQPQDIFVKDGKTFANVYSLCVHADWIPAIHAGTTSVDWVEILSQKTIPLKECDVILMRKDPPVDLNYIYTTYLLELAEREGVCVFNKPQSVRDANEKLFIEYFLPFCPLHLVTKNINLIQAFLKEHKDIIVKPLNNMGGTDVFHIREQNKDIETILTRMTSHPVMVQKFVEAVYQGDKRILLIDGKPVPHALARIPKKGDFRGNLAAGGSFEPRELTARDREICQAIGPVVKEKQLLFVGLDIIGDFLTEINVTCPTCIRQFDQAFNLNVSAQLLDAIERHYVQRR